MSGQALGSLASSIQTFQGARCHLHACLLLVLMGELKPVRIQRSGMQREGTWAAPPALCPSVVRSLW